MPTETLQLMEGSGSTMSSLERGREIQLAKERLASAKARAESASKNFVAAKETKKQIAKSMEIATRGVNTAQLELLSSQNEMKKATESLKAAEKRREVVNIDSDSDEEEEGGNSKKERKRGCVEMAHESPPQELIGIKSGRKRKGDASATKGNSKKAAGGGGKPAAKPAAKLSKSAMGSHRKWQAEAKKQGGLNAKIVVNKPEAKKIIFEMLYEEFTPMNINGVFTKLKATVPYVVLKSCLDDMVDKNNGNPFAEDSDDDDDESSFSSGISTDEYAGSLRLKEGRNVNNNLYYVDHAKQANDGNGLVPEKRNELVCHLQKSKEKFARLNQQLKAITAQAVQLESEPKNEELILEVADMELKLVEMGKNITEMKAHAAKSPRSLAKGIGPKRRGKAVRKSRI